MEDRAAAIHTKQTNFQVIFVVDEAQGCSEDGDQTVAKKGQETVNEYVLEQEQSTDSLGNKQIALRGGIAEARKKLFGRYRILKPLTPQQAHRPYVGQRTPCTRQFFVETQRVTVLECKVQDVSFNEL